MKRLIGLIGLLIIVRVLFAGGSPSKGTPKDGRLAKNKPKPVAQSKVTKAMTPVKKGK